MKKFIFLVLIIISSVALAGCKPEEPVVVDPVNNHIIWWGIHEEQSDLQTLINDFIEANPGITVEYIKKDKSTYIQELKDALTDSDPNNTPDIFVINNSWAENYASYVANAPASVYTPEEYNEQFYEFVGKDMIIQNQIKGVPLWVDNLGLVYNTDVLKESGNTVVASDWINFKQQAIAMTKFDNRTIIKGGFSAGTVDNVEYYFDIINLFFLQSRPLPLSDKGRVLPFEKGEEANIENAISFYGSFDGRSWNDSQDLDTTEFLKGNLGALIIPSIKLSEIVEYQRGLELDLPIATAPIPQLNSQNQTQVNFATYWPYVVSKESSKVKSSWEILKLAASKDGQEKIAEARVSRNKLALISPRKDMVEELKSDLLMGPYANSIENSTNWKMYNGEKLKPVFEELINGGSNLEDVMNEFNDIKRQKNTL